MELQRKLTKAEKKNEKLRQEITASHHKSAKSEAGVELESPRDYFELDAVRNASASVVSALTDSQLRSSPYGALAPDGISFLRCDECIPDIPSCMLGDPL